MFEVVVFLACRRAEAEGSHGPRSRARLPYTLEGVTYTFRFSEPDQEPPIRVPELWFYLRFNRTAPGPLAASSAGSDCRCSSWTI